MTSEPGVLAIFHEARAGREAEYDAWYQTEHLVERLSVPGFLYGRRYKGIPGTIGYFAFYVVTSPAVLTSKPYLERLDNPTPMTRRMMAEVFFNMNRTVCTRKARCGHFRGAYTVVARLTRPPDEAALSTALDKLAADTAVAGGEIWIAADAGVQVSEEEKLRGGDRRITGALVIDTLYQADAEAIGKELKKQFPDSDVGTFAFLCEIGRGDL